MTWVVSGHTMAVAIVDLPALTDGGVVAIEVKDTSDCMCLAIPARIIELEGDKAVVDAMGNRWKAKTTLLPDAKLGDLVLVHAGFAISLVDEEEAKKTWELFAEISNFDETPNRVSG